MLSKMTIRDFNEDLASNSPAPGGGAVAALLGSIATGLCSMMGSLTIDKKNYEGVWADSKSLCDKMQSSAKDFYTLMDEDASSFDGVIAALKMPKNTEQEKELRRNKIQDGYKVAIAAPIKTANKALELFDDIEFIVKNGNKNVVTDGLAAAITARAAVEMALLNVKINLGSVKDETYVSETKSIIDSLESSAKKRESDILNSVTF